MRRLMEEKTREGLAIPFRRLLARSLGRVRLGGRPMQRPIEQQDEESTARALDDDGLFS